VGVLRDILGGLLKHLYLIWNQLDWIPDERRAKAAEAYFHYLIPPGPGEADRFPFRDDPKAVEALQIAVEKIVCCAGKCIGNVTSQAVESLNALFADRQSKDVEFTAMRESRSGISVLAWNDPE
jgi:hypothetical protein